MPPSLFAALLCIFGQWVKYFLLTGEIEKRPFLAEKGGFLSG